MDRALHLVRPGEPAPNKHLLPSSVLGMLLFIFTEVMLFAGFISAHTIARAGAQAWPPAGQPRLPFRETLINSAALLASGAILLVAHLAFRKRPADARGPASLALLFGLAFVIAQGREWVALIGEGLTLTSSTYGGFFYLIVGAHALHALGAILALAWALARLWRDRLSWAQFSTVAAFWYFVVLVWPVIYLKVYL